MNQFGEAWLLARSGDCIEVYAHPSESFEFESVVVIVSKYGSESDKTNCEEWKSSHSDDIKVAILRSYNQNWCKVRLWKDSKLTFRISTTDYNWYRTIVDFLYAHKYLSCAFISVSDTSGKIYWDDLSYSYCIDSSNEKCLSCFRVN